MEKEDKRKRAEGRDREGEDYDDGKRVEREKKEGSKTSEVSRDANGFSRKEANGVVEVIANHQPVTIWYRTSKLFHHKYTNTF